MVEPKIPSNPNNLILYFYNSARINKICQKVLDYKDYNFMTRFNQDSFDITFFADTNNYNSKQSRSVFAISLGAGVIQYHLDFGQKMDNSTLETWTLFLGATFPEIRKEILAEIKIFNQKYQTDFYFKEGRLSLSNVKEFLEKKRLDVEFEEDLIFYRQKADQEEENLKRLMDIIKNGGFGERINIKYPENGSCEIFGVFQSLEKENKEFKSPKFGLN